MVDCLVEFDYDAEQEDELTIKVGEIIKNVKMEEGGWWEGELNGKKGLFPDNFVKVMKADKVEKKEDPKKEAAVKGQQRSSVKDLANKLKDVHIGAVPQKKKESLGKKKMAKVAFSYDPENEDELKLEVGDIVEVLKQEEEGWWEGNLNGKVGVFPSNFVELIDESSAETEKTDTTPEEKSKDVHEVKGKRVIGVGLGNIFGDGPIKLRTTAGSKKEQPPPEPEEPAPVLRKDKPVHEKAVVRYSYDAENEDELTLTEGEIINILEKELEDAGWWKGEINGKVGVFPDNFVEIIDEKSEKGPRTSVNKIPPQPKPKKPPPPSSSVTSQKTAPKLPEKAPVADKTPPILEPAHTEKHVKTEPAHTEKHVKKKDHPDVTTEKHAPPLITSKKPSVPPPVGRKPAKPEPPRPSDHKITSVTTTLHKDEPPHKALPLHHHSKEDVHKETPSHVVKEEKKDSTEHFDSVEVATEKLTHLTANRAKGPTKRPPSQVLMTNEEERNGDVKDTHWLKEEKPHGHGRFSHPPHREVKEESSVKDKHHSAPPSRPPEPSPGINYLAAIDELKKEIRELRANSVTKSQFEALKAENDHLKREIETLKSNYSRKFKDLLQEVDEEKKIRLSTQVEIDRIRKLVTESHV